MSRTKYSAEFRAKISQECIDGIGTIGSEERIEEITNEEEE